MTLAAAIIAIPFVAAAILAAVPSWRIGAHFNALAAALVFALACGLLAGSGEPSPILLTDALAVHLVLLSTFIATTTAWFSIGYLRVAGAQCRLGPGRARIYHAAYQCLLGGLMLGVLANNLGVAWVGLETAMIATAVVVALPRTAKAVKASLRLLLICGAGLALALFGTLLLYLALPRSLGQDLSAMSWTALAGAAPRCDGAILNLAFVFLLIGYGTQAALAPLHTWIPSAYAEGPTPVSAVLAGSAANVALVVILRLRAVVAANPDAIAPGPPIMALGLLSVLVAAFSLWRRRNVKSFFAFSSIGQTGLAAFAFGLGGELALFGGLLHITVRTLADAAIFQAVGRAAQLTRGRDFGEVSGLLATHRALGLTLASGIVAVAALPPFGLFTSEFLIMTETTRRFPLLVLPLGVGLIIGTWALIARLQTLCFGAPAASHGTVLAAFDLAPAWLLLMLVFLLGLAMPHVVFVWLRDVARAAS